jgi:hypothetical protein
MDWAPSPSVPLDPFSGATSSSSDSNWLRPQRFFAPSEPTGLESLLEKTNLLDPGDEEKQRQIRLREGNGRRQSDKNDAMTTYLVALLVAVLLGSALLLRAGSWRLLQGYVFRPSSLLSTFLTN